MCQQAKGHCASSWQSQAALAVGDLTITLGAHSGSGAFPLVPGVKYLGKYREPCIGQPGLHLHGYSPKYFRLASPFQLMKPPPQQPPVSVNDTESKTDEAPSPPIPPKSLEIHLPQHPLQGRTML